jgi:hypothetical protein
MVGRATMMAPSGIRTAFSNWNYDVLLPRLFGIIPLGFHGPAEDDAKP